MNFCVNEPLISQILPLFFNSHCFAEGQLLHPQILFFTSQQTYLPRMTLSTYNFADPLSDTFAYLHSGPKIFSSIFCFFITPPSL